MNEQQGKDLYPRLSSAVEKVRRTILLLCQTLCYSSSEYNYQEYNYQAEHLIYN